MVLLHWILEGWTFDRLCVVVGLFYTGLGSFRAVRAFRADMNFRITEQHHKLWAEIRKSQEWRTLSDRDRDLSTDPLTEDEIFSVNFIFNHLRATYRADQAGTYQQPQALSADLSEFMSYPALSAAWNRIKVFHEARFVRWVESR